MLSTCASQWGKRFPSLINQKAFCCRSPQGGWGAPKNTETMLISSVLAPEWAHPLKSIPWSTPSNLIFLHLLTQEPIRLHALTPPIPWGLPAAGLKNLGVSLAGKAWWHHSWRYHCECVRFLDCSTIPFLPTIPSLEKGVCGWVGGWTCVHVVADAFFYLPS